MNDDWVKAIYEAAQRGEFLDVPVADADVIDTAAAGAWENLQKSDNRFYGLDILIIRLCRRIKHVEALLVIADERLLECVECLMPQVIHPVGRHVFVRHLKAPRNRVISGVEIDSEGRIV